MAIVDKQVIRFAPTRKLQGKSIDLGNAGDNMVRRLMFALPEVDGAQTATLMYGGKYADMIQLTYEDGKWVVDLTAEMIGEAGEVEGYVRVDGPEGEIWHSDAFRLVTGDVPQIEVQIEKLYPTAVDQMLTAMAEHKTEMDAAVERAEAAADRAEASGGGGGTGGEAGKDGEDGGYYKPSVSSSGNLSWTASKPDMPAVATVNIRGPQGTDGSPGRDGEDGQDGYTPVKGVDYFDGKDGSPGEDGFSPTVSVTEITGGHRVTITDKDGPKSFDVANGKDGTGGSGGSGADGEDGGYYQPSVSASGDLSWSASKAGMPAVATVNIRGPEGKQGVQGEPGSDGQAGKDGDPGQDGFSPTVAVTDITGGHRVTITDATGAKSIDVMDGAAGQNGSPGQDGQDGENGFSPTVSVSAITGGHQVSVTDANGTKTFDVMDGQQGPQGETGPEGPQGPQGEQGPQGIQGPEGPQGPAGSDATVTVDSTVTSGGTNPVNSAAVIAYAMPVTAIVFTETDPGEDTASSYPDGTVVLVP